jgi:hypothetical protein
MCSKIFTHKFGTTGSQNHTTVRQENNLNKELGKKKEGKKKTKQRRNVERKK